MGAAIPVSRSECDDEILVLKRATARTEPAIGVIIGRWITRRKCHKCKTEIGKKNTAAVEGLASTGRRAPASTEAEDLAGLKV
jgi:hypothetical protein